MLLDSRDLEPGQVLEADVCVIGAGAAGITLARELAGARHRVILLEGGGTTYGQASQALYAGSESGSLIQPDSQYLTASRLRYLGGSTNHWHGWCRPLDAEDFARREWVPESGWPLRREELDPWYERAAPVLEITPFDYDQTRAGGEPRLLAGDPAFEYAFMHLSPPTRFGTVYRTELERAAGVRLILHGNVTAIEVSDNGRRVTGVEAARTDGSRFRVRSGTVVLAAGGIENARLLLLSDAVHRRGLGNERDLVGRYFMDHPVVRLGEVALAHGGHVIGPFEPGMVRQRGHRLRAMLRPTRQAQREGELLNALVVFRAKAELPALGEAVLSLARQTRELVEESPPLRQQRKGYRGNLEMVGEPLPDRRNRVRLVEERDALGLRRAALDWRLTGREAANFRAVAERLTRSLGEALRGRQRLLMTEEDPWARTRWSNHHIGTTRMDPDPARGVVDLDCRVHGVAGLYVAGSSVFPTAGVSNPTYTVIALTLRLADHLKAEVLP